ncbi:hypothetical protein K7X08_038080 [Anisodus acutangulus]|uniref:C2H2-type domain-containing protein n=1 Tax=Anisodus acutangulus TaxID=402998 RepID=A0A9Q1RT82_9SOLA|nr:hypothetical protein K7X08_038080 [Anisodus acutangulus]
MMFFFAIIILLFQTRILSNLLTTALLSISISGKPIEFIKAASNGLISFVNEWRRALCQVSATNQDGLNNHLQGKKHKHKEAALREQKDEKNCSIGFFQKKPKFIQLVESCDDMIPEKKSEEGSSGTNDNDPPSLLINDSADEKQNSMEHENRGFKFWYETCNIGTTSIELMETRRTGKKHARQLQQLIGKDKQC